MILKKIVNLIKFMPKKLKIYTDGGARGNPGPAAFGVVIEDKDGKIVGKFSKYLGETTNNQAEYQAIHFALEKAKEMGASEVELFSDSELIVNQLNQDYKIKNLPAGNPPNMYGNYIGSMSNHDKVFKNIIDVLSDQGMIATNGLEGLKTVEIIQQIYNSL